MLTPALVPKCKTIGSAGELPKGPVLMNSLETLEYILKCVNSASDIFEGA